ncbi:elongator complex protein 4 [Prorops nasuta]|uniref:elongator complex protein 4 n=1 Tax=Prorops nasuta TaxID=863751 RepID=UPI0034CF48DE
MSKLAIKSTKLPAIVGTKPSVKNAQLLSSSGIPSLDNILGGGLPIGSLFTIEEDPNGTYAKVLLKYFMAEGIFYKHSLLIASLDNDPVQLALGIPTAVTDAVREKVPSQNSQEDKMKIAWRYQNMKMVDAANENDCNIGHSFDLRKTIQKDLIYNSGITLWPNSDLNTQSITFNNPAYENLLFHVRKLIHDKQFSTSTTSRERKLLRITIHSLGSRLWVSDEDENTYQDLLKFLYCFKVILRKAYAIGVVSIPIDNFEEHDTIVERIEHISDAALRLESFADSAKGLNPLFQNYHGLLHIKKLPSINMFSSTAPESSDLAFKLRRKVFVIETLHLPPAFDDTAEREQDDVQSMGCIQNMGKKLFEF